jgi:glyoxylase-like metal-dependent hydrolase (beta-lactamase superfamily II)
MFDTLQRLCRGLPPETRVFPGHDYGSTPSSRLRDELRSNPYLQHGTLAQFVAHRMAPRMPAS